MTKGELREYREFQARWKASGLTWGYNLADGETVRVDVYREHDEWGKRERWFQMPPALLQELYVASYEVDGCDQLLWIREQHPDCVLVY